MRKGEEKDRKGGGMRMEGEGREGGRGRGKKEGEGGKEGGRKIKLLQNKPKKPTHL